MQLNSSRFSSFSHANCHCSSSSVTPAVSCAHKTSFQAGHSGYQTRHFVSQTNSASSIRKLSALHPAVVPLNTCHEPESVVCSVSNFLHVGHSAGSPLGHCLPGASVRRTVALSPSGSIEFPLQFTQHHAVSISHSVNPDPLIYPSSTVPAGLHFSYSLHLVVALIKFFCCETFLQRMRLNGPPPDEPFEILATLHITSHKPKLKRHTFRVFRRSAMERYESSFNSRHLKRAQAILIIALSQTEFNVLYTQARSRF